MLCGRHESVDQVYLRQKGPLEKVIDNSKAIGNKSKGTNCHISDSKKSDQQNACKRYASVTKMKRKDYAELFEKKLNSGRERKTNSS